jgi:hypothetical protein
MISALPAIHFERLLCKRSDEILRFPNKVGQLRQRVRNASQTSALNVTQHEFSDFRDIVIENDLHE